ncbi:hypothetical protein [Elizabethkingia anophelis]|uniref:hypothetical protein n=1 Tax=Elizabethkingia anophelis TaxID=1117645 RepID=UPI0023E973F2|nr:hypothetical protein [Elizabethkingia anophelis]GJN60456.1 hypothetical protein ELAK_06060 [Elizabethkingia anophelis]HDP3254016.1 hypothetical protein [Elizabethkingia anophelis]
MKTKFVKIPVSERLPEKSGYYDTDCGNIYFKRTKQRAKWKEYEDEYGEGEFPEFWLEEKEDHSEEMLSLLEKSRVEIARLKRAMLVHPDCEEGSEFDDYTTSAQETENEIEELINKINNGKI